jgi:hypothetical protein
MDNKVISKTLLSLNKRSQLKRAINRKTNEEEISLITKYIGGVIIVLAYLGSQCTKFHTAEWMDVLIFYVLSFGVAMNPTNEWHQILCKSQ